MQRTESTAPKVIDSAKCQRLLAAAKGGDITTVVTLATDPQVDINFAMTINPGGRYDRDGRHTALSVAIKNSHADVARFLLQQPNIEVSSSETYDGLPWCKSVLVFLYRYPECRLKSDLALFKMVLRAMPELSVEFYNRQATVVMDMIQQINHGQREEKQLLEDQLNLFFHEAVLRNDNIVIDDIIKEHPNVSMNTASFQEYIYDREFNPDKFIKLERCLDQLVVNKIIDPKTCVEIKAELSKRVIFKVEVSVFPLALQTELKKPCARSLKELYAEFQHWMLPEECLPAIAVDSAMFEKIDRSVYPNSIEEMRGLQNPAGLRKFLAIDRIAILMRLNACNNLQNENPAAVLLAQILLFHHNTLLDDKQPLLNEEQQKICLLMLRRLYELSDVEKLVLSGYHASTDETRQLRSSVEDLKQMLAQTLALVQKSHSAPAQEIKEKPLLTLFSAGK